VISLPVAPQQLRPVTAGGLHGDDATHFLPVVVRPLDEAIHERPQEASSAELKDGFSFAAD